MFRRLMESQRKKSLPNEQPKAKKAPDSPSKTAGIAQEKKVQEFPLKATGITQDDKLQFYL